MIFGIILKYYNYTDQIYRNELTSEQKLIRVDDEVIEFNFSNIDQNLLLGGENTVEFELKDLGTNDVTNHGPFTFTF